jgi:hypothetical protein
VLGVREAALTALMSILQVRVFEPAATGDNFTARGDDAAKEMAKRLRGYWKEYGGVPFDERMMKVLTDPKTRFDAKREAAENLASLNEERRLRTTIYPTIIGADTPKKPNPAIAKFSKPSVAEAILVAMDADLKAFDAEPSKDDASYRAYKRRDVEGTYLSALVELGDGRVAPEAAKRAGAATDLRARRQWAQVAHSLGDPKPFLAFAEDFRAGKINIPDVKGDENDLSGTLRALIGIEIPETERALAALTDPKHPLHKAVAQNLLTQGMNGFDRGPWFSHPFCLTILRKALDDTTPSGAKYVIEKETLWHRTETGGSGGRVPEFLSDPAVRREEVAERKCDAAAEKLGTLIPCLPLYHPMFKDADKRLEAFKAAYDRFVGSYRRTNWREVRVLDLSDFSPSYLPDIRSLGRAATADDVKAGRAVFHLDGKGKTADLKLPAVAVLKRDGKNARAPKVIVVQAEVGPDGGLTFGVLSKQVVGVVPGHDLMDIKSFAQLAQEEQEAAEMERKKAKKKEKDGAKND